MNTSKRFTEAVSKLYNAFHKGELNAMDCEKCAVGNICNNMSDWRYVKHYNMENENSRKNPEMVIKQSEYDLEELIIIEKLFMYGIKSKKNKILFYNNIKSANKELQFKGLCAVVEYLCELDNIPNVMDIQSLFEYNGNIATRELSTVFI